MTPYVELKESADRTLRLVEVHARQIVRTEAVAKPYARIVKWLRKRWRRQLKAVLEHNTLHSLLAARESAAEERAKRKQIQQAALLAVLAGAAAGYFDGTLTDADLAGLDSAVLQALGKGAEQMAEEIGVELTSVDLTRFEQRWLRDHGFSKIAADLDRTTVERIRDAVTDAYLDGKDYDGIVGAIKAAFADMSETRADLIATTELNSAFNHGALEFARLGGVETKSWNPLGGNVCPTCEANASEGQIPIDQAFSSGDDAPPNHPNCACVLDVGLLPE